MTGIVAFFSRIRRRTSIPSMSGSLMSSVTRFGRKDSRRTSACFPSTASPTSYPSSERSARYSSRMLSSSSTTRTFFIVSLLLSLPPPREDPGVDADAGERTGHDEIDKAGDRLRAMVEPRARGEDAWRDLRGGDAPRRRREQAGDGAGGGDPRGGGLGRQPPRRHGRAAE